MRLNPSGQSLRFVPEPGFSGEASVSLYADDGFGANDPYVLSIEVSDAFDEGSDEEQTVAAPLELQGKSTTAYLGFLGMTQSFSRVPLECN